MRKQLSMIQVACQERGHIHSILPAEPVHVLLEDQNEHWLLTISKKGIDFSDKKVQPWQLKISAKEGQIAHCLAGEQRLFLYHRMGKIDMLGLYRLQLWFESLLWLCRAYK
ncbi:hypothetical protein [Bacillus sp. REN10]|uniref:hypothetical protein n=1 Tax=Bacillus sp. REN10 TaxID=2782541 RepID=UPI00193B97C5|nr:hypothetical protein [Bacillus sp. REN10]